MHVEQTEAWEMTLNAVWAEARGTARLCRPLPGGVFVASLGKGRTK